MAADALLKPQVASASEVTIARQLESIVRLSHVIEFGTDHVRAIEGHRRKAANLGGRTTFPVHVVGKEIWVIGLHEECCAGGGCCDAT